MLRTAGFYYVVGPYRGETESDVRRNIERARQVAEWLWQSGRATFCPHLNSALMGGIAPDEVFLEGDLEILKHATGVVVVEGWQKSVGALGEIKKALEWGIPVYDISLFSDGVLMRIDDRELATRVKYESAS